MKALRWLALPVALVSAFFGLYGLHLRRARQIMRRTSPEMLVLPDPRPFDADLHLEGVPNARDIGGYRTADGRRVRRGMVYRSGDLSAATDHDLERLQALDVQLILDLRHDDEVADAPDRLPAGTTYARLPFNAPARKLRQIADLVINLRHLDNLIMQIYLDIVLKTGAPNLGILLHQLAEDDRALPVLIHCTAGKDRTGITSALLLSVLGVPDEAVFADYSLSNRYYPAFVASTEQQAQALARIGLLADDLHPLLLADPATLQTVFNHLRLLYGSLEGYLSACAGVDDPVLERLRARLLEPDED